MVDGPNLYAFVGNRPTYAFDPWGLLTVTTSYETSIRYGAMWVTAESLSKVLGFDYAATHSQAYVNGSLAYNLWEVPDQARESLVPGWQPQSGAIRMGEFELLDVATIISAPRVVWGLGKGALGLVKARLAARKAAQQLAANATKGAAFENAVREALGLSKNTSRLSGEAGTAIPDSIKDGVIIEIKNQAKISMDDQFRVYFEQGKPSQLNRKPGDDLYFRSRAGGDQSRGREDPSF